jgi:hypothetical protein
VVKLCIVPGKDDQREGYADDEGVQRVAMVEDTSVEVRNVLLKPLE